ncbi:MAG: response regulator [Sulfurovum sp.]|nr:response regulator [Sulfurovum sp.]
MDFTTLNNTLLNYCSDTLKVQRLLKEYLGAKYVDILYYDKEKSQYVDNINEITIQSKYLNAFSLLGHAVLENKVCFYKDVPHDSKYNKAIDNPFNIELSNQIIYPIFSAEKECIGLFRFSQLPLSFTVEDSTKLSLLLPTFQKILLESKETLGTSKRSNNTKILQTIERAFNRLLESSSNPEIEKLIILGHKNLESLGSYLHSVQIQENKALIKAKMQRLSRKKVAKKKVGGKKVSDKKVFANVLIADDVRINVKILNAMLCNDAIIDQIKHAYDGVETMDIIDRCKTAEEDIHILFLDHHMPGKTGLEIAQELKEKAGKETKIIIVSITNDPEVIASKEYLYDYHIPKPFNKESIQKIMERIRVEHLS